MVQRVKKELNFARKVVICDSSPCQLTTVWQMHAQKLLRQHVCISRRSITESCQFHYKATTTFGCCNLHKRYHTSYFVGMLSNISDLLERKIKSYVAPRFFFFFFFFLKHNEGTVRAFSHLFFGSRRKTAKLGVAVWLFIA